MAYEQIGESKLLNLQIRRNKTTDPSLRSKSSPYLSCPPSEPLKFTTAHRVFGASNIIKFLQATIHVIASHLGARLYEWSPPTPTLWKEHLHNFNSGLTGHAIDQMSGQSAAPIYRPRPYTPTTGQPSFSILCSLKHNDIKTFCGTRSISKSGKFLHPPSETSPVLSRNTHDARMDADVVMKDGQGKDSAAWLSESYFVSVWL